MTQTGPESGPGPGGGGEPEGRLRPTGPAPLAVLAVLGLVVGWTLRLWALRSGMVEPEVSLASVGVVFFVAAIIAGSAYLTRRTVRRDRHRLEPHHAVNRLVLARACALVGALLAGGYAGYGITWLGDGSELATERLLRCGLAALGALAVMITSLVLERACRVPPDDPEP